MGLDNPAWHTQQQTAKETASQELEIVSVSDSETVTAGSNSTDILHTNNSGELQLLELVTLGQELGYVDEAIMTIRVRDTGGTQVFAFDGNNENWPVALDPALPVREGETVEIQIINDSATDISVLSTIILRQL